MSGLMPTPPAMKTARLREEMGGLGGGKVKEPPVRIARLLLRMSEGGCHCVVLVRLLMLSMWEAGGMRLSKVFCRTDGGEAENVLYVRAMLREQR